MAIAFIASASGEASSATTWNVTRPSLAIGDVCLVLLTFDNNNGPVITPPTDWQFLDGDNYNNNCRIAVFRKVWDGTEADPLSFSFSAAEFGAWITAAYSGVDNTTPEDATTVSYNSVDDTTTPTQSTITTVTDNAVVVGFWGNRSFTGSASPGGSATERQEHPRAVDMFQYAEDLLVPTPTATSLSMTLSASQGIWQGVQVALRPFVLAGGSKRYMWMP